MPATNDATAVEPESLFAVLAYRAAHSGPERFIITPDLRQRSYADVYTKALRLGDRLAAAGVKPGDVVGLYFENGPAWVVAVFAVWSCGATAAACGRLVPAHDAVVSLHLAGATTVTTTSDAAELAAAFQVIRLSEEGDADPSCGAAGTADASARDIVEPLPDSVATVIFSSGTTGTPKGIPAKHRNYITGARQQAAAFAGTPAFRRTAAPPKVAPHIIFSPFGHGSPFGQLAFRMWIGKPVVLVRKFDVDSAGMLIESYRPTTLQLSPAMIHMLADTEREYDLSSLKYISSTNDALPGSVQGRFESRYSVPIFQAYGMTETGVIAQDRPETTPGKGRKIGSSGVAAAGVRIRIEQDGIPVEPGADGEIVVQTPNMRTEFLGGNGPAVIDGWLHTGDIGHLDDEGYLFVTGRTLEKLVVGGLNVYPAEVEEAMRESPLVDNAVLVGIPDERLGEVPVAGVVWAGAPDPGALLEGLRDRLAHYKVPRLFFDLPAVPLTPRGKVDRRTAKNRAAEIFVPITRQDEAGAAQMPDMKGGQ